MLLDWGKKKRSPKKEIAAFILGDWLGKCLHDIKESGLKDPHWHPPTNPPACGAGASHMPMRDGGYCTAAWSLISALRPKEGRIPLDAACRLLRALHHQADICGVFKSWRNKLIRQLALLLQLRVRSLPFVSRPDQAILDWHIPRGTKGKHKDHDEDLDENVNGDSDHVRPNQKHNNRWAAVRNVTLATHTYLYETERHLKHKRKLSISFDESNLGRESTLTAIVSSHEANLSAWLLPQVTSPILFARYLIRS